MPFQVRGFMTLRIYSNDIRKSCEWYAQLFGVKPVEDTDNFASFNFNGIFLDIAEPDAKSPVSAGGSTGYWLVDDLDPVIARATELGAKVYRGPMDVKETQRRIMQVMDPYGNVMGFEAPLK